MPTLSLALSLNETKKLPSPSTNPVIYDSISIDVLFITRADVLPDFRESSLAFWLSRYGSPTKSRGSHGIITVSLQDFTVMSRFACTDLHQYSGEYLI